MGGSGGRRPGEEPAEVDTGFLTRLGASLILVALLVGLALWATRRFG